MHLSIKDTITLIPNSEIIKTTAFGIEADSSNEHVSIPSIDTRSIEKNGIFFAFVGENSDGHAFISDAFKKGAILAIGTREIDAINIDPETKGVYIQVKDVLNTLQEMAKMYREKYIYQTNVIGVTGSVGKTTVKDMLSAALRIQSPFATKGNFNNHIGVPLMILSIPESCKTAVLEAGMNHRGEMQVLARIMQPEIVVITHIGVAHIEYLKTRDEIALEKLDLAIASPRAHTVLIPQDDTYADFIESKTKECGNSIECIKTNGDPETNGVTLDIHTPGTHMLTNAYLAYFCAKLLEVPEQEIIEGLKNAAITPRRLEVHEFPNHRTVIDDSYNANPDSMRAGLLVCNEYVHQNQHELQYSREVYKKRIAILGGMAELGEESEVMHQDIVTFLSTLPHITDVYFVGELAEQYMTGISKLQIEEFAYFKTFDECLEFIKANLLDTPNILFFIKGSKSTHMSTLADLLIQELQNPIK